MQDSNPDGATTILLLIRGQNNKKGVEKTKNWNRFGNPPYQDFLFVTISTALGSGILEGYVHFLSILVLEAPQCREGDRRFVERKKKKR